VLFVRKWYIVGESGRLACCWDTEAFKLGHPSARGDATVGCGGIMTFGANGHGLFFPGCMDDDLVFGLIAASLGKLLCLCLFLFLGRLCALGRG
jgi:hypothetical protein